MKFLFRQLLSLAVANIAMEAGQKQEDQNLLVNSFWIFQFLFFGLGLAKGYLTLHLLSCSVLVFFVLLRQTLGFGLNCVLPFFLLSLICGDSVCVGPSFLLPCIHSVGWSLFP